MSDLTPGKYYLEVELRALVWLDEFGGVHVDIPIRAGSQRWISISVDPSRLHPVPAEPEIEYGVRSKWGTDFAVSEAGARRTVQELIADGDWGTVVCRTHRHVGPWVDVPEDNNA